MIFESHLLSFWNIETWLKHTQLPRSESNVDSADLINRLRLLIIHVFDVFQQMNAQALISEFRFRVFVVCAKEGVQETCRIPIETEMIVAS